MLLNALLLNVRREIAAAEDRAAAYARAVTDLLAAGQESIEAEQALFCELDSLALLRGRLHAIEGMRDQLVAA